MKRFKKVLCFVLPLVLVVAVVLGICLSMGTGRVQAENIMPMALTSDYGGQVVTSDEDTGARTAARDYKAGAIFLEPYSTMTMSGGVISGHQNTYGGAIYVSEGATFTMTAGTISNNKASYGGAIYVESGGECYIEGGTITLNSVSAAGGAIFVETGGILEIDPSAVITENDYPIELTISAEKEQMGGTYNGTQSSVELYTTTFGSYPQTYVGDDMNAIIETWFSENQPAAVKSYTIRKNSYNTTGLWPAYKYIDGDLYVREKSCAYGGFYQNGDKIPADGTYVWFKVEPIKWFIMNYDAWQNNKKNIELFSAIVLTGNICFNPSGTNDSRWSISYIRKWCNNQFYNEAFSSSERIALSLTTVKNNITNNYDTAESDGSGPDTEDHIYLKSCYEMMSGIFTGNDESAENGYAARICAPSDFALSNEAYMYNDSSYTIPYRSQGPCSYWLRSAGTDKYSACFVSGSGRVYFNNSVNAASSGVRPALRLNIAA